MSTTTFVFKTGASETLCEGKFQTSWGFFPLTLILDILYTFSCAVIVVVLFLLVSVYSINIRDHTSMLCGSNNNRKRFHQVTFIKRRNGFDQVIDPTDGSSGCRRAWAHNGGIRIHTTTINNNEKLQDFFMASVCDRPATPIQLYYLLSTVTLSKHLDSYCYMQNQ